MQQFCCISYDEADMLACCASQAGDFLFLEMSNLTPVLSSSSSVSTYILRVLLLPEIEPNAQNIFTYWGIVVFETVASRKFRVNSRRLS